MEQKSLKENNLKKKNRKRSKKRKLKFVCFPIWLRLLIVAGLIVIMVIIGALIGYSVIGGGNPIDVFKPSTWTHIVDIVNQGTMIIEGDFVC